MGGELAPEKNTLFVEQLLVEQIMGLVGLAESIETSIADLFDARTDLLRCKSVAIAQDMLVLAGAIDEDWLTIEEEAMVARWKTVGDSGGTQYGPRNAANAKWRAHIIESNEGWLALLIAITIVMVRSL